MTLGVVIVEDSEDNAELLAALLEDLGYHVRIAHDGPRAMELVAAELPNVVILDLGLPGMDGFEVAKEMRRRFGDQFRIIALTGYSGAEQRARAERSGIDSFVTKPFHIEQFQALIATPHTRRGSE